jgi:hypothetical protein
LISPIIINIAIVVFYISLACGVLFFVLLLFGKLNTKFANEHNKEQRNALSENSIMSTGNVDYIKKEITKYLSTNATYEFRKISLILPNEQGKKDISFFDIRCALLLSDKKYYSLRKKLKTELFRTYYSLLKDSQIFIVSQLSFEFLLSFRREIKEINSEIYLYNQFEYPLIPNNGRKKILFDLSYTTGQSLGIAINSLKVNNIIPEEYLFIFYNDFIPRDSQDRPWDYYESKLNVLYCVSQIISYWKDETEAATSMLTILNAMQGSNNWDEPKVQQALNNLKC